MNTPEYKILEGYTAQDLEKKMNEAAQQGFTPLGDIQIVYVKTGDSEHTYNGYTVYLHKMFKTSTRQRLP